jgi:tetratricopeptide (TPR) repeat protein
MGKLKQLAAGVVTLIVAATAPAQGNDVLQRAFDASYTAETSANYTDAIAALTSVYEATSYPLNLRLGWLQYQAKDYAGAAAYYQKAVELRPYSIEAKFGYVKPLAALEKWDAVLRQYQAILAIDEQNTQANYWAASILYNRKEYAKAAKYLTRVVNLYPFDYSSSTLLAWTYLNLGESNSASALFSHALLIKPGDSSALEGLGKIRN